jgi:1-aminocyclopropane-1-carboxylate deaminase/D-cysteine desulfhydrase-like pyridoxal-dependent ACC family enzyme
VLPTPLVPAPRLARALDTGRLFVKRDDLTGFAIGGNKARPLEFLLAAALGEGADTLVTGGAPGSNFCAATAAAARRTDLACHLVVAGEPRACLALALAIAWGATVSWTHTDRAGVDLALPAAAAELTAQGRRPYLIPRGGATAAGAAGYALAAFELAGQLAEHGIRRARVVVAVGSGGTLAGLAAGNALLGGNWTLAGGSASRPAAQMSRRVRELAGECLALLAGDRAPAHVDIADVRGPGHGLPSAEGAAAAEVALRTEGLLADPVYTAKALPLLAGQPGPVVFWHTGGVLDAVDVAQEAAR